jgi:hypothetical protein
LRLQAPGSFWGGTFTASTGEMVSVFVSSFYPVNLPVAQGWANFLSSLVHGSELSSVQVYLAPLSQISSICGTDAIGCYTPNGFQLVAPADDPAADLSSEAVVAHEYGHHVEASRSNAPWSALSYGTKRWASYMQVCAGARTGRFYPGAETVPNYLLNPGEGFAETYRVLNERNLGLPESPWEVVSTVFLPDAGALGAARTDVTSPWRGQATSSRTGRLTLKKRSQTLVTPTPLDGSLRLSLKHPAKTRFTLTVRSGGGIKLAGASGGSALSVGTTVCGQRSLQIQVSALRGSGSFRLSIAKP